MDKLMLHMYSTEKPQIIDLTDIMFVVFQSDDGIGYQVSLGDGGLGVNVYGTMSIKPLHDDSVIITSE